MDGNEIVQTDADIIAEFEDLFSEGQDSVEEVNDPEDAGTETEADEESDESGEVEDEDGSDEEDEESDEEGNEDPQKQKPQPKNNDKKQKEAFYTMRTQLKNYENLFGKLSELFNLSESGDPKEVVAKIEEAITRKEAEKANVPVEYLQRMQEMEQRLAQTENIERQNRVTDELANLGDKYGLSGDDMTDFIMELTEEGKNPLESDVDLEAEYIKKHIDELLENARNEGTLKETERKAKIKDKAPGSLPDKRDSSGKDAKIESVADLNTFLDSL